MPKWGEVFGKKECQPPSRVAFVSPRVPFHYSRPLIPGIENAAWGAAVNIAPEPSNTEPTRFVYLEEGMFCFLDHWMFGPRTFFGCNSKRWKLPILHTGVQCYSID